MRELFEKQSKMRNDSGLFLDWLNIWNLNLIESIVTQRFFDNNILWVIRFSCVFDSVTINIISQQYFFD